MCGIGGGGSSKGGMPRSAGKMPAVDNSDKVIFAIGKSHFRKVVTFNGQRVRMLFDTGACCQDVSLINERIYTMHWVALCCCLCATASHLIKIYRGGAIDILGETLVTVEHSW